MVTANSPAAVANTSSAKNQNAAKFRHLPPPQPIHVKLADKIDTVNCDSDGTSLYDSVSEAETGL